MLITPLVIVKNARTTFDANPIICVSFTKEGKTQVGWVIAIR
jgi:hypothetical protein